MFKKLVSLLVVLTLVVGSMSFAGTSKTDKKVQDGIDKINSAKEFTIEESLVSLGKSYTIKVDGKAVATVKGKWVNLTGDVFTLATPDGTVLFTEKQIKRWGVKLTRGGEIKDSDDKIYGYLGEEVFTNIASIGSVMHMYDSNKDEIGLSDKVNISLTDSYNVLSTTKDKTYTVKKALVSLSDKYTVKRLDEADKGKVTNIHVAFTICVLDAIKDASSKETKKKKKKSN